MFITEWKKEDNMGIDHQTHKGVGGDRMHPHDKIERLVLKLFM